MRQPPLTDQALHLHERIAAGKVQRLVHQGGIIGATQTAAVITAASAVLPMIIHAVSADHPRQYLFLSSITPKLSMALRPTGSALCPPRKNMPCAPISWQTHNPIRLSLTHLPCCFPGDHAPNHAIRRAWRAGLTPSSQASPPHFTSCPSTSTTGHQIAGRVAHRA